LGVTCVQHVELTALVCWLCRMSKWGWRPNIPSPAQSSWLVMGMLCLF